MQYYIPCCKHFSIYVNILKMNLKKVLSVTLGLFIILQFVFVAQAKTENPNGKAIKAQNARSATDSAKEKTPAAKLNKILEVTENSEVEEVVEEVSTEQQQIEQRSQKALEKTEGRPAFIKFLIGPDYPNLGQLRKEVVQIRNSIRKLEKIQEKADEGAQPTIDAAILELEESASALQVSIYSKLSEFSLFGWLFRWLNGFTPVEDALPTVAPTSTPDASPSVSPSPTASASPSPTPGI